MSPFVRHGGRCKRIVRRYYIYRDAFVFYRIFIAKVASNLDDVDGMELIWSSIKTV